MIKLWIYVFAAVLACWFVFAAAFLFRKRPPKPAETKRAPSAIAGVLLQSLAYSLVWMGRANYRKPRLSAGLVPNLAIGIFTVTLAVVSVWLVTAAIRKLGKQWALQARIVEGHELITDGPYRLIRHPIYTGMFGMLVATGLAMSTWSTLAAGILLYGAGTMLRVKVEEELLKQTFGEDFNQYAARTPPLLPGLFGWRK
jgi:protein-S-isoprenylcysteine O-methyltransferase Ste14